MRGICGYAWFLAGWAKRMSWKAVAEAFQVSWGSVFRSVEMAVDWGRRHMPLDEIEVIGVDEILWRRGYRLLTLVYQIDESAQQARGESSRSRECPSPGLRLRSLMPPASSARDTPTTS